MVVSCIVCQSESKYKCSSCYKHYCSSGCWKVHKDGPNCVKPEKDNATVNTAKGRRYVTEDTVPVEKLQRLSASTELRQLLKDPLLQKLLIAVDISDDPYSSVQKAMQDTTFVKFVDTCLGIVEESVP